MSIDLQRIALELISKNPQVANNPRSQEMINVIQSGDQNRGEQLARNLCQSYGMSPEQATAEAKRFFHIP